MVSYAKSDSKRDINRDDCSVSRGKSILNKDDCSHANMSKSHNSDNTANHNEEVLNKYHTYL